MARRRHYRGLVRFPGLGLVGSVPKSINTTDAVVGVGLGLAGSAALKMGLDKMGVLAPAFVTASPLVGAGLTGLGLYLLEKRKNRQRALSHAVGAALGGIIVWGYGMLVSNGVPGFSDMRTLPNGYGAPIFQNPRGGGFGGPIFQNPRMNMARLAQLQGLGDENEDGLFPAP